MADLTISEGALLAGLPKAPSRYSPRRTRSRPSSADATSSSACTLDGFLDDTTYETALAELPVLAESGEKEDLEAAAHFTEEVRRDLFEELGGNAVLKDGVASRPP